jgi:hypothetical protein
LWPPYSAANLCSLTGLPQNLDAAIKQLNDQALDIAVHRLGPNGAFGWVARLGEDHGGMEYRWRSLALSAML